MSDTKVDITKQITDQFDLTAADLATTELRYGENPHQSGFLLSPKKTDGATLANAKQLQGKELSYNNYLDLNAALTSVREFAAIAGSAAAVIVKHLTPCGIAVAPKLTDAYKAAWACDTTSAFGGVMAFNRIVTAELIQAILTNGQFVEAIIAPSFEKSAIALYASKPNVRLLELDKSGFAPKLAECEIKSIDGGLLVQNCDIVAEDTSKFQVATKIEPNAEQTQALNFAWRACKCVKSNAIVIARQEAPQVYATVGIGAGQPNRVNSAGLAVSQAGFKVAGSVAASDAFLPFSDTLETLSDAGIKALIQPGGSVRDDEVINKANQLGVTMVFTGYRHFRH